ncbi:MAG: hypothetical protein R3B67_03060 [Phycisphaerales bacterium]
MESKSSASCGAAPPEVIVLGKHRLVILKTRKARAMAFVIAQRPNPPVEPGN